MRVCAPRDHSVRSVRDRCNRVHRARHCIGDARERVARSSVRPESGRERRSRCDPDGPVPVKGTRAGPDASGAVTLDTGGR
jgi:hypothetical protein